jgi:ADP-ribosylglycohydrolase
MSGMTSEQITRAKNSILGAFVADAATMGFHWLYSQRRIAELAPSEPEFRQPSEADFEGNVGYFAHGGKKAGEYSHYGEQAWVILKSMASNGGNYEKHLYQDAFRDHFGYGGEFRGYIDRPTRETLDTIYQAEGEAVAKTDAIEFKGDPAQKSSIFVKILAAAKRYKGQVLIDEAHSITGSLANPTACLEYALALVKALGGGDGYPGAHDEQLPAISKLPVLVARYANDPKLTELATSAIKVTNNAPRAIDYGMVSTATLAGLIQGSDVSSSISDGLKAASKKTREHLSTVLSRDCSVSELTREFGLHCDLGAGMASTLYNLKTCTSYTEAIRKNIYVGGDNCGRSIMLGAACGATYGIGGTNGVPEAWIEKIPGREALLDDIDSLFA